MKLPVSWIKEYAPVSASAREIADALINAGLEVEGIETVGHGVIGQLVVGKVLDIEVLTEFKKPIRWCQVDVGTQVRGIICGASNFAIGDFVVVAQPGVVLPGDFTITSRETYGHVSDGMICSEREMGLGDDHAGIMVLDHVNIGDNANELLGIGEQVLDIAVTPDRGYALSVRGVAREVATAFGVDFIDPAEALDPALGAPSEIALPRECAIDDFDGAKLLTLRTIVGFDPTAPTPRFMSSRLQACGMRSISLAVDVTNYVMLETGQPTHAFDLKKVQGPIRVSRARDGDTLETLDHVIRELSESDVVIADDSGPIGLAGTMGGFATEIDDTTVDIALEAAFFPADVIARNSRRHKLSSEASRRFERGVDRVLAPTASARACALLIQHGGGTYLGMTAVEAPMSETLIDFPLDLSERTAGMPIDGETVRQKLTDIGALYEEITPNLVRVTVPSWRPDITQSADLVEEVVRLVGYEKLPSTLPGGLKSSGLTHSQRLRRRVGSFLAARGLTETLCYPFIGESNYSALRLPESDPRRLSPRLANPLSDEAAYMRTTLLPGLLLAASRNVGRGETDLALFEVGSVFLGNVQAIGVDPGVQGRPPRDIWEAMQSALPLQPHHLASVLCGASENMGVWGKPRPFDWTDALGFVEAIALELGVRLKVTAGHDPVFHPGRCAEFFLADSDQPLGHAGELHPQVALNWNLPSRACAVEIDLDMLIGATPNAVTAPEFSTAPVAKEDLAFVVPEGVAASQLEDVIRRAGGERLESVRLFDVYSGGQIPEGQKSLAYALRLRDAASTLSAEQIAATRSSVIAAVEAELGGSLR